MDESVVKHLEQQAKITKLSEAIRIGSRMTKEGNLSMTDGGPCCAIGAACCALGRTETSIYSQEMVPYFESLGIAGAHLAVEVSEMHWRREMNREQLADWLEGQGY